MDGEMMITVIATGFGHEASRPRAEKGRGVEAEGHRHSHPWKEEVGAGVGVRDRWGTGSRNGDSLEVPAFLRKQMD
jgi:hypothetical protein